MDLGDRLKYARELRGIKQTHLDRLAGVGQGVTGRMEAKKRGVAWGGTSVTVERLAKALGVRAEWLRSGEGPMEAEATDPLPRRALAVLICREAGISEAAIAATLALNVPNAEERATLWWIDAIRLQEGQLRLVQPASEPPSTMPAVPSTVPASPAISYSRVKAEAQRKKHGTST